MRVSAMATRSCSSTPSWCFCSMISFSISAFSVSNSARKAAILASSAFLPVLQVALLPFEVLPAQERFCLFLGLLSSPRRAREHPCRTEIDVNQLNAVFGEHKLSESGSNEPCRATSRPICRDCVLHCFRCGAAESRYPSTKKYRPLTARERFPLPSSW